MNEQFFRILNIREKNNDTIIDIALVSSITDSYETVIVPTGCISPLKSVPVDYNHNRISTGSYLVDAGIGKIEVPTGEEDGSTKEVDARMVEVHIPSTARMWTKDNKEKRPEDVPNLQENVKNGRVAWGSVDFAPVERDIERVYDSKDNLIREVYKKWRLNFFSLLDTKPGQDTSYVLNVRVNKDINKTMSYKKGDKLKVKLGDKTEEREIESVDNDQVKFIGDDKLYSQDEVKKMSVTEAPKAKETEGSDEEKPKKKTKKRDSDSVETDEEEEDGSKKRVYVGSVVKNGAGSLGVVTKVVSESSDSGNSQQVTIETLEGEETTVDGTAVGHSFESEGKTWVTAGDGEVILYMIKLMKANSSNRSAKTEAETKLQETEKELEESKKREAQLEKEKKELTDKYKRLHNSPDEGKPNSDPATDMDGEDADEEESEEESESRQLEEKRQEILFTNNK